MAPAFVKSKKFRSFVTVPVMILIAGFLRSVCVEVFTLPYNFAPGGSTGIAAMVEYKTGFLAGWTTLIINVPLLILAWFFLDKWFAVKSGCAIGIASLGMLLMERYDFPTYAGGEPVLAAAASGVLGGVGLALMLRAGGSTGGSDIVAMFIQRKFSATNVAWFIYAIDAVIVFVSAFVYSDNTSGLTPALTPVLMSLVEMFCLSMISDVITSGFKTALKFEIITHDPEAISQELLTKLGRGVTCSQVTGMYSHDEKSLLICVIRKHQLSEFNKILKNYPDTFAYVTNTREVMGLGFSK